MSCNIAASDVTGYCCSLTRGAEWHEASVHLGAGNFSYIGSLIILEHIQPFTKFWIKKTLQPHTNLLMHN